MITIESKGGRLIGIRQTGRVTTAEVQASIPQFQAAVAAIQGPIVLATDWRGMRLMDSATADLLIEIMKHDEGVDAQVVITDQSALIGLQIRRLFRAGGGRRRAVYDDCDQAQTFLDPHLSAPERTALREFVANYVPEH